MRGAIGVRRVGVFVCRRTWPPCTETWRSVSALWKAVSVSERSLSMTNRSALTPVPLRVTGSWGLPGGSAAWWQVALPARSGLA
ncbi:hypothetical protein C8D88_117113 [Lentzea atacamensis]|uniref:Uncharacterized protein n=1 Tax=Lentzea atacamensis TaxID=531938 RepID=A0A316HMF0_9PSEU|nr:hypothetical protein C8D88_117113 [Lentzea atacamensis]